jgi:hypothetical protein
LCVVAQGAKTVIVGQEVYEYDQSRMLVFSVALPITAQITQASHSEPYLALRLDLDPHKIAELVLKVYPHGLPQVQERSAVYVTPVDMSIVNAATRLVECLAQPGDAELLAPLVVDEILIRLLRGCPCQKLDRPQRAANSQGRQRVEGVAEQVRATDFMAAGTRGRSSSQGPESSRTSVNLGRKASFLCPRKILQAARRS